MNATQSALVTTIELPDDRLDADRVMVDDLSDDAA